MTDIELWNENGKIVAYDADSGEKVPVSVEGLEADSFHTEDLSSTSLPMDYVLVTDGSTIDAFPHSDNLTRYTGETDIGALLNTIIIDELPPKGSQTEAAGLIRAKAGNYPGKLDYSNGGGVPLPSSCHIIGEGRNHMDADVTRKNLPETEPTTLFEFDQEGFKQPNVNDDLATFPLLRNLHLRGPGPGTAGSNPLNGNSGSNRWDWLVVEDVVLQSFDKVDLNYSHHLFFNRTHFIDFNKLWDSYNKSWYRDCGFWSEVENSTLHFGGVPNSSPASHGRDNLRTTWVRDSTISMNITETSTPGTKIHRGHVKMSGNQFNNIGDNTADAGVGLLVGSGVQSSVQVIDNHWLQNDQWDHAIKDESAGVKNLYLGNRDYSNSSTSLTLDGVNGLSDPIISSNVFSNGTSEVNSPTRPRYEGKILLSGVPDSANYSSADSGVEILDTSVSPPDIYWVATDGSLFGPK